MSAADPSDSPARVPAVLAVLVEVELDPAALDEDVVARAAQAFASRVAGQVVAEGVRAGGFSVRVLRCSMGGLVEALAKVTP